MDKISKALKKLTTAERKAIKKILIKLQAQDFAGLNLKKLRGRSDIFRIRKRKIRIIFRRKGGGIFILSIERRSDKTYRGLK